MNANENQPDDPSPVADENVERLLAGAYRPEVPDAEFVDRTTAAMQTAAGEQAAPTIGRRRSVAKRLLAWTAAASLLVAVGAIAGTVFLAGPGYHRQGMLVWIDGQSYVDSRAALGSQGSESHAEETSTAAAGRTPSAWDRDSDVAGLTARPEPPSRSVERLREGQSLTTGAADRRRVLLDDGSVLYVNENTTVKVEASREVTLDRGEVYVEVARSAAGHFLVNAGSREIVALGTKFDVRRNGNQASVLVTQGRVQLSGVGLPIEAGQQLAFAAHGGDSPPIMGAPRTTHAIEWTRDLLARAHSPLVPDSKYSGGALVTLDPQGQETRLSLRKYHVDVYAEDGFARTTIDQTYFNHTHSRLEGTFYFPLPPDASLSRLAMYVNGRLMEGGMAERDHARQVFESIVARMKDPALLEWIDGSTFKMRVFPLEPRQEKRIILSYTQRLPSLYGRTEYRFPGGHNLPSVGEWSAQIQWKNGAAAEWKSPSHQFQAKTTGGDLVLDASAKDVKPDRDIVLTVEKPLAASPGTRFASFVQDGAKYLMLRWRPELPADKRRQHRDWIILFETPADRDPVLARSQIEVVKTLLENAEHDDTFSILTAATRAERYRAKPQVADADNVRKAVEFLERAHLVGALDLGRAFDAAQPLAKIAKNPVLVHVGSGVPVLGLREIDDLVKRIPQGTQYVGVGVGKRWNRSLMKTAAARTGGYFTQINPTDEIRWRAMDLLATLNTPRLLNVRVNDAAERLRFLVQEDSLADGEELCAIARLDKGEEVPKQAEVTGMIEGKLRRWTLTAGDVLPGAGYLPRTWAKLEIDRLVAEGAEKNRPRIVELSKAMYVMSPFTSLLVLENEEMYAQYKVDRGRKDHWAMYACPAQIAVVTEPAPGQVAATATAPAGGKKLSDVLDTVATRVRPSILTWPARGRMVQANTSGQWPTYSVLTVPTTVTVPDGGTVLLGGNRWMSGGVGGAGTPILNGIPYTNYWFDGVGLGRNTSSLMMMVTPRIIIQEEEEERLGIQQSVTWDDGHGTLVLRGDNTYVGATIINGGTLNTIPFAFRNSDGGFYYVPGDDDWSITGWNINAPGSNTGRLMFGVDVNSDAGIVGTIVHDEHDFDSRRANDDLTWADFGAMQTRTWGADPRFELFDALSTAGRTRYQLETSQVPFFDHSPLLYPDADVWRALTASRREEYSASCLSRRGPAQKTIQEALRSPTQLEFVETPLEDVVDYLKDYHGIEIQLDSKALDGTTIGTDTPVTKNLKGVSLRSALRLMLHDLGLTYVVEDDVLLITTPEAAETSLLTKVYPLADIVLPIYPPMMSGFGGLGGGMGRFGGSGGIDGYGNPIGIRRGRSKIGGMPRTYVQPRFSGSPAVFADLVSYAPGMQTNFADLCAVAEAEMPVDASAAKTGKIDDRARRLIERARGAGWQTATFADQAGKPLLSIDFDGTGRYRYERVTSFGLREQVVCDGASLWHLYPEIGIGAQRKVSRINRGLLTRIIPWVLPPVEDLARGADLVAVDDRTVAIVPNVSGTLRVPSAQSAEKSDKAPREAKPKAKRPGGEAGGSGTAPSPRPSPDGRGGQEPSPPAPLPQAGEGRSRPHAEREEYVLHLVFADDGRLAERRIVEKPSGKILARETYAAGGTVTVELAENKGKDAGGTPAPQFREKIGLRPCGAPELKPDGKLVVPPLPLRSRQHLHGISKLPDNGIYGAMREEDALALLAADLGANPNEVMAIIGQRFFRHGDRRLGFYTLLVSSGYTWKPGEKQSVAGGDPLAFDPRADHPGEPAARYLAAYLSSAAAGGAEFGKVDLPAGSLLQQLAEFHDVWTLCQKDATAGAGLEARLQHHRRAIDFIGRTSVPALAWSVYAAVQAGHVDQQFHRDLAKAMERLSAKPGFEYLGRYEQARHLSNAGDHAQAQEVFEKLYADTLAAGILPPIDAGFRNAFVNGQAGPRWATLVRDTAKKLIAEDSRLAVVSLAWQVQQAGDQSLAEEILKLAPAGAAGLERSVLSVAMAVYCRQTGQYLRADELVEPLLGDKLLGRWAALWRLAESIAEARGQTARALEYRQRALEIEYERSGDTIRVEVLRRDYGDLLSRYEKLAASLASLESQPPRGLLARVIRAADQWRRYDPDPTAACQAAARIFGDLGAAELAWDYLTTPLSAKPNEAAPWVSLAQTLRQQGHIELADRAYASAFEAEPTNAQILWDRAQALLDSGRTAEARKLFRQLADGQWQPRFSGLQAQAKERAAGW